MKLSMHVLALAATLALVAAVAVAEEHAAESAVEEGAGAGTAIDAAALWKKNCASCHGDTGKGDTKMGKIKGVKDLTDPAVREGFDREQLFKVTKEGIVDPETKKTVMKAYGDKLSDEEITALVDHIYVLCGK
jgi:mono/diheme cytochrome c family protein